jgi:N-acetylmuramoyl-L-alanine amidase
MEIVERSSPSFGPRRNGLRPQLVVLHHTAMLTAEAALERLCDPASEVSAHYLVAEDGRVWRLVPEAERAWHAGEGSWGGTGDVNSRSIGIELANAGPLAGFPPFPEPQMAALEALLDGIMARWSIPPAGVIAHSDMAPGRKADPGPKLDWRRLARGGRAVWTEGEGEPGWAAFRAAAAAAG